MHQEDFAAAVDKTRNMEHSGTFRNIPEHRIIMIKYVKLNFGLARVTIWSAQIGHVHTVAHNCHGKRINLPAKRRTSRQKEKPRSKKKKTHGKKKKTRSKISSMSSGTF